MILTPNLSDAEAFFSTLAEGERITFQYYDDTKKTKEARHFTEDYYKAFKVLEIYNKRHLGIYWMVNEGNGKGRSAVDVVRVRALFADLDGAPLEPILTCKAEPHLITETSPGRYQAYWLVDDCPLDMFGIYQKAIAKKFKSDESVTDLCRVMRVPGFYHQKAEPFLSRIHKVESGMPYKIDQLIADLELDTTQIEIESSPEYASRLPEVEEILKTKIPIGARHRTLLQYASKFAHLGRGYGDVKITLDYLNKNACEKPIDDFDFGRIIDQAFHYAAVEESTQVKVSDSFDADSTPYVPPTDRVADSLSEKQQKVVDTVIEKYTFSDFIYQPFGLVGEVFRYIMDTSVKQQPELALGAAILACGTVMGRKVTADNDIRTNLYMISVIESAAGKDWPRRAIKRIFSSINKPERAGTEEVSSDAAIMESVFATPSQVMLLDELGKVLKQTSGNNVPAHLQGIPTTIMKLYSSAADDYSGKAYAKSDRNRIVHQPCLSILGTSVARNFFGSLTSEAIEDGMLNRFLYLQSTDPDPVKQKVESKVVPDSIIYQFKLWEEIPYLIGDFGAEENLQPPVPRVIHTTPEVEEVFDQFEMKLVERRKTLRSLNKNISASLFGRTWENAYKIALIMSCGRNMLTETIDIESAIYGTTFALECTERLLFASASMISDSKEEAMHKKVLNIIKEAGPVGIGSTQVGQKTRGLSKRLRKDILDELIEWGCIAIKQFKADNAKKVSTFYYFLKEE